MIYFNEKFLKKQIDWEDKDIYVLSDFDNTLTSALSNSSWDVLFENEYVSSELKEKINKIFNYYSPIEVDTKMDFDTKNKHMIEWYRKALNLICDYKIKEDVLMYSLENMMIFREGTKEFLKNMNQRNIPVVIISGGIGNFIERFLEEKGCLFNNIYIKANFLKIENGLVSGVRGDVIHPLNKNEESLPLNIRRLISLRKNSILLGDLIADISMVSVENRENALKIGFLDRKIKENLEEYKCRFDVVGTNDTSILDLSKYVKILRR